MHYLYPTGRQIVFAARDYSDAMYDLSKSRPNFDKAEVNANNSLERLVAEILKDDSASKLDKSNVPISEVSVPVGDQNFMTHERRQLCNLVPMGGNSADKILSVLNDSVVDSDQEIPAKIDSKTLAALVRQRHELLVSMLKDLRSKEEVTRGDKKKIKSAFRRSLKRIVSGVVMIAGNNFAAMLNPFLVGSTVGGAVLIINGVIDLDQ